MRASRYMVPDNPVRPFPNLSLSDKMTVSGLRPVPPVSYRVKMKLVKRASRQTVPVYPSE